MTTIVFDGKTLASDSQSTLSGSRIYEEDCKKIFTDVGPFVVLGICGNFQDAMDIIQVIKEYNNVDQIRGLDYDELQWDASMIGITEDMRVWSYAGKDSVELRPDLPFAIGSGAEFALGAMYAGATATEALEAAARYDIYTNNVFQVVNLCQEEDEELPEDTSEQ